MHDPDCDEDPIENDDFGLDEIQDWDDFEETTIVKTTPLDVPENACPVCGLNLSCLDTMVCPAMPQTTSCPCLSLLRQSICPTVWFLFRGGSGW